MGAATLSDLVKGLEAAAQADPKARRKLARLGGLHGDAAAGLFLCGLGP